MELTSLPPPPFPFVQSGWAKLSLLDKTSTLWGPRAFFIFWYIDTPICRCCGKFLHPCHEHYGWTGCLSSFINELYIEKSDIIDNSIPNDLFIHSPIGYLYVCNKDTLIVNRVFSWKLIWTILININSSKSSLEIHQLSNSVFSWRMNLYKLLWHNLLWCDRVNSLSVNTDDMVKMSVKMEKIIGQQASKQWGWHLTDNLMSMTTPSADFGSR